MANEFEFELNGRKVYTGNILPETYPLSFKPFPETQIRDLKDCYEIASAKTRIPARIRFDQKWLINQGQRSSCNAYMAAAMLMRAIWQSTGKFVKLSPEFIYMHINGGRDNGSPLDAGMVHATDVGCCRAEINGEVLIPYQSFRINQIPMEQMRVATADAKNYRFVEAYQFKNDSLERCWMDIVTCIVGGGFAGVAVHVGRNYMRSGEVAGFDAGVGNHAVAIDDVIFKTPNPKSIEDVYLQSPQSWGLDFADNGWTQLTPRHIAQTMKYHGLYGVRSATATADEISNTRIVA